MRTLIIIPVYNEQDNIEGLINSIKQNKLNVDYIVINDCSTDNTMTVLNEMNANYTDASVNLGIGGAVQTGYRYALQNGYDIAIQVDGDGQHDVSYVPDLIKPIVDGEADICIGSRFINKEGFQSSSSRRMGINLLSGLIHICCGKKVRDVTSGFRAVNRKFIEYYSKNYPQDFPEPEAIVAAVMSGGIIKEVPVVMKQRERGRSSINLWKSIYYMIKVSLAIIVCRIGFGLRRQ